jgi:transposase
MRKSINGLSAIVETEMKLDLKGASLFIFTNKPRTHMKILYFDRSGFALWLKRLEGSKFPWPKTSDTGTIAILAKDMALLLEGINVWTRFEDVHFERVV